MQWHEIFGVFMGSIGVAAGLFPIGRQIIPILNDKRKAMFNSDLRASNHKLKDVVKWAERGDLVIRNVIIKLIFRSSTILFVGIPVLIVLPNLYTSHTIGDSLVEWDILFVIFGIAIFLIVEFKDLIIDEEERSFIRNWIAIKDHSYLRVAKEEMRSLNQEVIDKFPEIIGYYLDQTRNVEVTVEQYKENRLNHPDNQSSLPKHHQAKPRHHFSKYCPQNCHVRRKPFRGSLARR